MNSCCGPQVSYCCTVRLWLPGPHGCLTGLLTCCPAAAALLQAYTQHKVDEVLLLSNQLALLKQQLEAHQQEAAVQEARKDYSLQVGLLLWGAAVVGRCCGGGGCGCGSAVSAEGLLRRVAPAT